MSARTRPSASPICFVDTNVLVYAFDRSDPARSAVAVKLLTELLTDDRLRLSIQVLQEFFVTVTRKIEAPLAAEEAIAVMDNLAVAPVFEPRYEHVREAARLSVSARISFWDALIVVASTGSGAARLYSEDLNAGQVVLGVEIVNPFPVPRKKL
jgi:predicted nucleic acid-binding protein